MVDEHGVSVPLFDVYLHHWVVFKYYVKKGHKKLLSPKPKIITDPNVRFSLHEGHEHRIQFQEGADVKKVSGIFVESMIMSSFVAEAHSLFPRRIRGKGKECSMGPMSARR